MEFDQPKLKEILQTHFKYPDFRKGQHEVIEAILAKKDVLAVMPTSAGKSLCYQFPSVYLNKLVIVISPLISLMNDQVQALKNLNIRSGCLHSGIGIIDQKKVFEEISKNAGFLLYLSPERAYTDAFANWIKTKEIGLFAIDEAHCVSQWGHDFREEYSKLNFLKTLRPDVPIMALTATATPTVLSDISRSLKLINPEKIINGFYRPNLYYQVEHCSGEDNKITYIKSGIESTPTGRIIIYCGKREEAEGLKNILGKIYKKVGVYHGGMSAKDREETQKSYTSGDLRILCATNAFGMGIDQPDVRLVIHHRFPKNIESLYQEMGRAGRDGKESTCLVLFDKADKSLQNFFIVNSKAPKMIKDAQWKNLNLLIDYCESDECRHAEILTYFKDPHRMKKCGHCDSCLPTTKRRIKICRTTRPVTEIKQEILPTSTNTTEKQHEALVNWRRELAKKLNTTGPLLIDNRDLTRIVKSNPKNLNELLSLSISSTQFISKYGIQILDVLNSISVTKTSNDIEIKKIKKIMNKESDSLSNAEERRFELLKLWRKDKANTLDLPTFCILSNKTLISIAKKNPKTLKELMSIHGIGPHKLEQFGKEILAYIK